MNRGFSTIEIIIAMGIMVTVLASVVLVSFGSQMSLVGSETSNEALKRAQATIERVQALARKDFNLVNATTSGDGFYTDIISVEFMPDFLTKQVTVDVLWQSERGLAQKVELKTLVTDFSSSVGGSTCNSSLSGDWEHPSMTTYEMSAGELLPSNILGNYPVTDVDAYRGRLYVTAGPTSAPTDKTLFVFDISDRRRAPVYIGGTDNAGSTRNGLNAVKVAGDYAYVANAHDANFNSCSVGPSCSQLQIIDISAPSDPWNPIIVNLKFATSSSPRVNAFGGSNQAVGKSIFYKDGYIYLGLSKTGSGPEFNVVDVHNPTAPFWVGSWPASGTSSLQPINGIFVRNGYAYLAHPTDSSNTLREQLTVLNVANPQSPTRVSGFRAPDNEGNGKSLAIIGDTLYLGRTITTFSGNPEFYVIDISNPTAVPTTSRGNHFLNNSSNDLIVRDSLAFILTNNNLEIRKIDNSLNITPHAVLSLSGIGTGRALDCEDNHIYVGSADSSGNGFISVVTAL